jgi:hypothetical protein
MCCIRSYAQVFQGFIRDCVANPKAGLKLDPSEPLYIIELGAGSGKFSFFMLKALMEMKEVGQAGRQAGRARTHSLRDGADGAGVVAPRPAACPGAAVAVRGWIHTWSFTHAVCVVLRLCCVRLCGLPRCWTSRWSA